MMSFYFLSVLIAAVLLIVASAEENSNKKNLRGGDAGGVVQSNTVGIERSNIDGPMHIKLFNDYVKDKGAITPDSTPSPPGLPTFVLTEAPTEIPTESPIEQPTEMPTENPTTAIPTTATPTETPTTAMPTEAPTAPPPSGNASCGCSDIPTEVVERVSPTTGRTWMDRNLGASRNATRLDDPSAYGCLFQWGRGLDGSASMVWLSKTSGTGVTGTAPGPVNQTFPACNDTEKFITAEFPPNDWLVPKNDTLWQTGSPLDPCPAGYQVPNATEWELERAGIGNSEEGYHKLGLTTAGFRSFLSGDLFDGGDTNANTSASSNADADTYTNSNTC